MRRHPVVTWITLALAGLVVGAVITIAASRLARPNVGLSAEPPYAGAALAPPAPQQRRLPRPARSSRATTAARPVATPRPAVTTGAAPVPTSAPPQQAAPNGTPQPTAPSATPQRAPRPATTGDREHADD